VNNFVYHFVGYLSSKRMDMRALAGLGTAYAARCNSFLHFFASLAD